jgi:hypothetical protein
MSVWLPDPFEVVRWPIVAPVSCVHRERHGAAADRRLPLAEFRLDYIRTDGVRVYRWTRTCQ